MTIVLDWRDRSHWNRGRKQPCIHCGRPAFLLDESGRPAHKVCAEAERDGSARA